MIKIIKNGLIPTKKIKTIFIVSDGDKCPKCGCEFEFELEDCEKVELSKYGIISVKCPFCDYLISGSMDRFKTREEFTKEVIKKANL